MMKPLRHCGAGAFLHNIALQCHDAITPLIHGDLRSPGDGNFGKMLDNAVIRSEAGIAPLPDL